MRYLSTTITQELINISSWDEKLLYSVRTELSFGGSLMSQTQSIFNISDL